MVHFAGERLRSEARFVEQAPERVAATCEMMTDLLGTQTRVDTNEQDTRFRRQDVAQRHFASSAHLVGNLEHEMRRVGTGENKDAVKRAATGKVHVVDFACRVLHLGSERKAVLGQL